jgi:hypothetical protein
MKFNLEFINNISLSRLKQLAVVFLVVASVVLLIARKTYTPNTPSSYVISTPPVRDGKLNVKGTEPTSGTLETENAMFPITVNFYEPVDLKTIEVTVEPAIEFKLTLLNDDTTLWIEPESYPGWVVKTPYLVKVTRATAVSGKELDGVVRIGFIRRELNSEVGEGIPN